MNARDPLLLPPDPLWVARILVLQQQAIVCRLLAIVEEADRLLTALEGPPC